MFQLDDEDEFFSSEHDNGLFRDVLMEREQEEDDDDDNEEDSIKQRRREEQIKKPISTMHTPDVLMKTVKNPFKGRIDRVKSKIVVKPFYPKIVESPASGMLIKNRECGMSFQFRDKRLSGVIMDPDNPTSSYNHQVPSHAPYHHRKFGMLRPNNSHFRKKRNSELRKKKVPKRESKNIRNFQKRKSKKEIITKNLNKEIVGRVAEKYFVKLKPCRRLNTGFATSGLVPLYICSSPYKYLLKIESLDTCEEQDFDFNLIKFLPKDGKKGTSGRKVKDGLHVEQTKSEFENGKVIQLFRIQFTMTSFLNQSVEFKLNINNNEGDEVFLSQRFRIVARKNRYYSDKFWNQFREKKERKKYKKKDKVKSIGRKRRRRSVSYNNNNEEQEQQHGEVVDENVYEEELVNLRRRKKRRRD